jgi:hypothetical protein
MATGLEAEGAKMMKMLVMQMERDSVTHKKHHIQQNKLIDSRMALTQC